MKINETLLQKFFDGNEDITVKSKKESSFLMETIEKRHPDRTWLSGKFITPRNDNYRTGVCYGFIHGKLGMYLITDGMSREPLDFDCVFEQDILYSTQELFLKHGMVDSLFLSKAGTYKLVENKIHNRKVKSLVKVETLKDIMENYTLFEVVKLKWERV